ncbi:probable serine incorporator [Nematostella vectensis]|uniref:probable serine incorporator n=1 Tax=Nematostella vectensis TaxID=45351 RepID=UPI0020774702|nr:probable serine incorporator [Nematostella vectensis]
MEDGSGALSPDYYPRPNEEEVEREAASEQKRTTRAWDVLCVLCIKLDAALCCGFILCRTCLASCFQLRQSAFTRVAYIGFLLGGCLISCFMLAPQTHLLLGDRFCQRITYFACDTLRGYSAVYRVLSAIAVFFFILALLMFGLTSSRGWRARANNGLWAIKILLLSILTFAFLFIPHSEYTGEIWMFFGLNGGFTFIILQFMLLIDLVHCWNTSCVERLDSCSSYSRARVLYCVLWIPTILLFTASVISIVLFFHLYAGTGCRNNTFFICFNVYICLAATYISVNPVVQEARPRSGLLQAAVTTSYNTYVTWLALSNAPDKVCNPSESYLYPGSPFQNLQLLIGLGFMFFILLCFSLRRVKPPQYGKIKLFSGKQKEVVPDTEGCSPSRPHPRQGDGGKLLIEDELNGVEYSYSFFHTLLCLAALYSMMTITDWYRPEEGEHLSVKLISGWGAVWIRLSAGIFSVFIYIWTLIAPVMFPNSYKDLVFFQFMLRVEE